MTSRGEDGIRELKRIIEQRQLAYRNHECTQCCTLENLPDYDTARGGFIDPDDPSVIHEPASLKGQLQLANHVRKCHEAQAHSEFTEALERFESGAELPDDLSTAGCAAYWVNIWLAPETDLQPNPSQIERNSAKLLGMNSAQISAFVAATNQKPLHAHARPTHAAAVLKKYLETGDVSWDPVVVACDDHDCEDCYPHYGYCNHPDCPEFN